MGFNTVAVLYNDATDRIRAGGNTAERLADAMSHGWLERRRDRMATDFGAGVVISQDHADNSQVVIVGRNSGCTAKEAVDLDWWALQQMAECRERHGYKVTKPKRAKAVVEG